MLLWVLVAVLALLIVALAGLRRAGRLEREQGNKYIRRLEDTQEYLQQHVARLDTLVAMLASLYRLGMSGTGPANRRELCDTIVQNACRLAQTKIGSLMLLTLDGETLEISASQGLSVQDAATRLRVGEGIAGRVAQTGKTIYVEDIRSDKRFLRSTQSGLETQAMVSVPLRVKDRVIGVLNVNAESARFFEEREIRLLGILADQAAITLENFELYDSLRKFNIDLMQTLLQALEAKEANVQKAPSRAHEHARAIAQQLDLPEQMIQYVEYAAMMRGIGKLGIVDSILRKPGKLTSEEYALVKKHPKIGSQIISPMSFLAPAAPMVLYHQEWYNGQGYPDGLAGEEIPLGARIVSVVSAWEAMTSDRPYRKALSREAAIQELKRGAGSQFDPKIVDAFLRSLEAEEKRHPSAVA